MRTLRHSRIYTFLMLAYAAIASSPFAFAQQNAAETTAARRGAPTVLTYEVGDLVVNVPDYSPDDGTPAAYSSGGGGGMGGGGGGFGGGGFAGGGGRGGVAEPVRGSHAGQITMDDLIHAMVKTVAPDTWNENGAGDGEVEPLGDTLVVLQTPEVHDQIRVLLDRLREGSATRKTVTVDARWLLLDSDDLERLMPEIEGERKPDRQALAEFTRQPTSLRGITNCFSGQLVYLISGTRRNVVSSYIPVVGSVERPEGDVMLASDARRPRFQFVQYGGGEGGFGGGKSVGFQPIIEKPNFGVLLEIRPTFVLGGRNTAVIDLKSTVTFPAPDTDLSDPTALVGASGQPAVDRLAIQTQDLATTLRVPLGEPVLVGGMTYMAPSLPGEGGEQAAATDRTGAEKPQLYLVLELR